MRKVALIGANGQVGAELCLLLARMADIELVPICRNRTGSAFLRLSGIACRHGRVADPSEAPGLIGDCDVIVNCALGTGTPAQIRAFDRNLLRNLFAYSRADAVIIHFSTVMVHGDPRPGPRLRLRNPYGRAKLAAERRVRAESVRTRKPGYTLRLGHVCGPLQNITEKIRREISAGPVPFPSEDVASNTVYTVTIIDALQSILARKERPGAYDLMNVPQWTWSQVYEFESRNVGNEFTREVVTAPKPAGPTRGLAQWLRGRFSAAARIDLIRQSLEKILALAPQEMNDRAQASWFKVRARAEIGALLQIRVPAAELSWVRLDVNCLTALHETRALLEEGAYTHMLDLCRPQWSKDLPLASETSDQPLRETGIA